MCCDEFLFARRGFDPFWVIDPSRSKINPQYPLNMRNSLRIAARVSDEGTYVPDDHARACLENAPAVLT